MFAARAGTDVANTSVPKASAPKTSVGIASGATTGKRHPGFIGAAPLLQLCCDVFGVLLVTLKNLQPGLQQALQLAIAGRRDQLRLQRVVDRLVVGNFVGDVSLVECGAAEFAEFGKLVGGILRQRL